MLWCCWQELLAGRPHSPRVPEGMHAPAATVRTRWLLSATSRCSRTDWMCSRSWVWGQPGGQAGRGPHAHVTWPPSHVGRHDSKRCGSGLPRHRHASSHPCGLPSAPAAALEWDHTGSLPSAHRPHDVHACSCGAHAHGTCMDAALAGLPAPHGGGAAELAACVPTARPLPAALNQNRVWHDVARGMARGTYHI